MIFNLLEYRNFLHRHNVHIVYSGPIWAEGIETLGDTIRKRLKYDDAPFSVSQSVFSVFVEQMNNMLLYSAEKEQFDLPDGTTMDKSRGIFTMGMQGGIYFIQCGNIIRSQSVDLIKERIDYVNTLDRDGLRKYYKEQIKNPNNNPESRGAGLGIIEIAKRASSPIEYDFTPVEEGKVFFSMYVEI